MARIRSIHPGINTDEAWAGLSHGAWRLAQGLMMEADDAGLFEWKPFQLNMKIFPGRSEDMNTLLAEIESADILKQFVINGRPFGAMRNFCRFQRPRKPKYTHLRTQEVDIYVALTSASTAIDDDEECAVPQKSVLPPAEVTLVPQKSGKSPQREEGRGKREDEGDGKKENISVQASLLPLDPAPKIRPRRGQCKPSAEHLRLWQPKFAEFKAAYPPRETANWVSAETKFYTVAKAGTSPDELIRAATAYARSRQGQDPTFTTMPTNWLTRGDYRGYLNLQNGSAQRTYMQTA